MVKPQAGFSLIEIMISFAILAIALGSLCSSVGAAQQVQTRTSSEARALEQMEKVVEDIQNTAFGAYSTRSFDVKGLQPQTVDGTPNGAPKPSIGTISIGAATTTMIPYVITAQWQDMQGPMTYTITYVHVNRGG